MADRVGVIRQGELILVEDKADLMRRLGTKRLTLDLEAPLASLPDPLASDHLVLTEGGRQLVYSYDPGGEGTGIATLLDDLARAGIRVADLRTEQSSLEDIFVRLVGERGR